MGTWGVDLYSNDFGQDLRSAIKMISRLPFDEQQLTQIAISAFKETAENHEDEDHTVFWLVLADQFHRRGIVANQVFVIAREIIKNGQDIQICKDLGMSDIELEKRRQVLNDLHRKLEQPVVQKSRNIFKKPQPLLMSIGDVLTYPVDAKGACINPYISNRDREQDPRFDFKMSGWGVAVIVSCGRVFDFIPYYTPLVIQKSFDINQKPTLDSAKEAENWKLNIAGVCSKSHFKHIKLEVSGKVDFDDKKLKNHFRWIDSGIFAAIHDISIANRLDTVGARVVNKEQYLTNLNQIIVD